MIKQVKDILYHSPPYSPLKRRRPMGFLIMGLVQSQTHHQAPYPEPSKNPVVGKRRRRRHPAIMAAVFLKSWPFPPPPTKTLPTHLPSPSISASSALVSTRKFGSLRCGTPAGRPAAARWGPFLAMAASNVVIAPEENEPEESLVRRFRSKVLRAGVIQECKRRRFFETKQEERKRKAREAAKRNSYRRW